MSEFVTSTIDPAAPSAGLPEGLVIAASQAEIDGLVAADTAGRFAGVRLCRLAPDDPLPADVLSEARLLVLEVDTAKPASLQRIRAIRSQRRALPVIAALRGMDVAAVRMLVHQGILDVTELPFEADELVSCLEEAHARLAPIPDKSGIAPLIAMVGGVGGSGTTTVLTHFAAHVARGRALDTCVVDLDVQSGEVAYYCGHTPRITIEALLSAGDRLDKDLISSAVIDSGHGFAIIAAPEKVLPLDEVNVDQLLNMLAILRRRYALVLVDLPTDWTSWGLSVADACTAVALVTDMSVASLRQAKRRLDLFEQVGIGSDRLQLVANRVEHKVFKSFDLDDAAEALGRNFIAALPDAGHEMTDAQDEGLLLFDTRRRTKFEEAIAVLGNALLGPAEDYR
ncbi:CpaE family protein [Alteraurantiacibacter aestuarii]|uniref:Pilus assembly protein CpaE n=1 Tax=Alteraurantiacibacter aestuarii TaxID=650004 RepID=A0A844ZGH1_9SPHN|nr:hypothetical protein [Alteraurantiacibacter aestuarii]MXO87611.1 hypothetical protein [Alteraurantiacibacter aestuarii]